MIVKKLLGDIFVRGSSLMSLPQSLLNLPSRCHLRLLIHTACLTCSDFGVCAESVRYFQGTILISTHCLDIVRPETFCVFVLWSALSYILISQTGERHTLQLLCGALCEARLCKYLTALFYKYYNYVNTLQPIQQFLTSL